MDLEVAEGLLGSAKIQTNGTTSTSDYDDGDN
jgi:hypothetical protein